MGRSRRGQRFKSLKKSSCSDSDSKSDDAKKNMYQNSNSTKSCKVISKQLLPEDLIFDILTYTPPNFLINSALYVCKYWSTTIRSIIFTEACLRHAHSKPGIYVENLRLRSSSYFLDIKDDLNGHTERIELGTPPSMGRLIGTCHGMLLLTNGFSETFVVNPILKHWLRIPPLPISPTNVVGIIYYQLTITRVPHTAKFKLFLVDIVNVSGSYWRVFYVLRIGIDNSWKEIDRKEFVNFLFYRWKPVYSGGNDLYWITKNGVTAMDVDKEIIVREYSFNPPLLDRLAEAFFWMENCLACIMMKEIITMHQIYILDFDSGIWSLYHEMGPFDYVAAYGHELNIFFMSFQLWINRQIIFLVALHYPNEKKNIFQGDKKIFFVYNVKTRQLKSIEGIPIANFKVWLHTSSLVSLPSTPT